MTDYDLNPSEREIADALRSLSREPITWADPPPDLWSRIEQALPDVDRASDPEGPLKGDSDLEGESDLKGERELKGDSEPAGAEAGHARQAQDELQQRRERRLGGQQRGTVSRRSLLAVAAGGLIAGTGLGAIGWRVLESRPTEVLATAELTPLDAPDLLGTAQVRRTRDGLVLELAASTPFQVATGYIEVWLINVDGRRMVSVGIYQGQRQESFSITPDLLQEGYVVVDLSRELFDDDATHSGDSLVRGRLNL